jgi:hypothetical protein
MNRPEAYSCLTAPSAEIRYWYLCPWEPIQESQNAVLAPLQNMRGTDKVVLCWFAVEHTG